MPRFSVVIPVYNRPQELDELLDSLCRQHYTQFEVIVVDDGSATPCEEVCTHYVGQLDIHYFYKQNAGPGPARNYGAQRAKGEYLIILDSDVILPEHYFDEIVRELDTAPADAFGGPDRAHDNFTPVQKAINYAMTSFFTTGGIRGGKKKMDKFYPRSFNLGIRTDVFCALNGFAAMRFGEDIDLSIRIFSAGCQCRLFPEAWVWHKRRATFRQFFKQVHNSGIARINLYKKYPSSLKLVHCLPAVFTLGVAVLLLCIIVGLVIPVYWLAIVAAILLAAYGLLILTDAGLRNKSVYIGLLSVVAAFIQLIGYGTGFLRAFWQRVVLHKDDFQAFRRNFYK
ncbi:MAG: glycosyltransferase [Bacteroidales bacterium]|nr:glycosyltransferase [Bacteroidales bacterium]